MPKDTTKLRSAVENYFADIARKHTSGGATPERSYYPPLNNLLNAIGDTLRPKVSCVTELGQSGADHPDWNYKLGGYQVLKKWLSYREYKILDRPLNLEEVQHFTNTARRIGAILEPTA